MQFFLSGSVTLSGETGLPPLTFLPLILGCTPALRLQASELNTWGAVADLGPVAAVPQDGLQWYYPSGIYIFGQDPTLYLPDSPHLPHPDPSLTGSYLYLKCRYFVHQECFHISFDFSKYLLLILRFLGVPLNFAHKTNASLASPNPGPGSRPHCNWTALCDKWDKSEACDLWGENTKDISVFIVVSWITHSDGNFWWGPWVARWTDRQDELRPPT